MSVEINKMQVDIDNLKEQNVNDFSSIKELYNKFKEIEEKITQIKYIDKQLANKLKKDYENLKRLILNENVQVELNNKIEETKYVQVELINKIEETKTELNEVSSQMVTIANKGTTVEVLERVTKEEIERQIADGTIANLTVEDNTIENVKLKDNTIQSNKLDNNINNILYNDNILRDSQFYNIQKGGNITNDTTWCEAYVSGENYGTFTLDYENKCDNLHSLKIYRTVESINKSLIQKNINIDSSKIYTCSFMLFVKSEAINDTIKLILDNTKIIYTFDFVNLQKNQWNEIKFNISNINGDQISLLLTGRADFNISRLIISEKDFGYDIKDKVDNLVNTVDDVIKMKDKVDKMKDKDIIMPYIVPVVKNKEINFYFDNCLYNTSINNIERISLKNNLTPNNLFPEFWHYKGDAQYSNFMQYFNLHLNNTTDIDSIAETKIINVDPSVGIGITKKCIFIGDSLTDSGKYETELLNLFNNDVMNIELLGTRGSSPALHEGRSSWTSKHYCTVESYNDRYNAFWNPSTSNFDFSYYMQQQGYTSVDYVFINLGTNDLSNDLKETITYFNKMLVSIKNYNSNITVFVGMCPPLSSRVDRLGLKNKRLQLMKLLKSEFGNRESEKIHLVPLYINIDPLWDFPYIEEKLSNRHNNTYIKVTDNTHCNDYGYCKMSDIIYYYIKYACSLDQ